MVRLYRIKIDLNSIILDLSDSNINIIPNEIQYLTNLQQLYLYH